MNIAIFGSCVSRDTCEFMPEGEVRAYVARQSVRSLRNPHGTDGVDLTELTSPFQVRMVTGDLQGNGARRITEIADDLDVVLVDLVDERRGYWLFSDGSSMTNSIEVELAGAGREARREGARLVEFGSDEHFSAWGDAFEFLVAEFQRAGLLDKTVFVDVEWAAAIDGSPHPRGDIASVLSRHGRRLRRGAREAGRRFSNGASVTEAWRRFSDVKATEAEEFADRAVEANEKFVRYRETAHSLLGTGIVRSSSEVRISREHKWGPQPFHYRDEDYKSLVESIREFVADRK
ncbi:DUF6270 domain-containing protein [Brevibacterium casei]|uniref:DUF6270 domain-containing protein n=1 Tax=Brevibacterium casei TaxID=33889 RepID=UPI00167DFF77|nr:DUF6270 domain-containing protein [Brevibacterium casei]